MQFLMEERTSRTEFLLLIFWCYKKIWETVGEEKTKGKRVWKRLSPGCATQRGRGLCLRLADRGINLFITWWCKREVSKLTSVVVPPLSLTMHC